MNVLCATKRSAQNILPSSVYDIKRLMPQVETTATVEAIGPFAQIASTRGVYLQRLDAQPSVSLTTVRH